LKGDKGETGAQGFGVVTSVETEPAGACANGGYKISFYRDTDNNGVYDSIIDTTLLGITYTCKGDKGDKGEQGLQGIQGEIGPAGTNGVNGAQGDKGDKGDKGDAGADGTSVKILGTLDDSSMLPSTCNNGDAYLISGNLWVCATNSWSDVGNIQGPQGEQGLTGDQGIQGIQGEIGPKGDQGIQGIQGEKGDKGEKGETGLQGIQGVQGIQGLTGFLDDASVLSLFGVSNFHDLFFNTYSAINMLQTNMLGVQNNINALQSDVNTIKGKRTLTVVKSGTGSGSVSSGSDIDCGVACSASYASGSTVTLNAVADATSIFAGWSGACTGTSSCTVTMDSAKNVGASFVKKTYGLIISRTGTGIGTITSSTGGIYCGASCAALVDAGSEVTLTATPDATSSFTGFSGACTGTGPCTLSMSSAKSVTASFAVNTYTMTIGKSGDGSGTITSSPAGISCGSTCAATFDSGTLISLSAVPDSTSYFAGWTGACSGTGPCIVTMNSIKTVTAFFVKNAFTLVTSKSGNGDGTITSTPGGINCGYSCMASYSAGQTVTLSAAADSYSTFNGWSGACTGYGGCTVTIDSAKNVAASFIKKTYTVSIARNGNGIVTSQPSKIYCGASCSDSFDAGSTVTFFASADSTTTFAGWSGACSGTSPVCSVFIDSSKNLNANFITNAYAITVSKSGDGTGNATSSPAGISCGSICSASYSQNALVTLTATPDSASSFSGWTGACSGTGPCIVTLDSAKAVTATFARLPNTLTISKAGTGTGTVTSSPAGINCGALCSASYSAATTVTLTATPDPTSTFAGWSGACSGTTTCNIPMSSAQNVGATFNRIPYTLTLTRTGGGTIVSDPSGIYCGATCSATLTKNTIVTLTAIPDSGATFTGWSGACTGTGACQVTMDASKTVSATFRFLLVAQVANGGTGGYIASNPSGINCGASCAANFDGGTSVTLSANPSAGYTFTGWSGSCAGTSLCTLTMNENKNVFATFTANTALLSVSKSGSGTGTITSAPGSISCGSTCGAVFNQYTSVQLTASPDATSYFTGWNGACAGTGACTVTMDSAKNVGAGFDKYMYSLSVSRSGHGMVEAMPNGIYCGVACSNAISAGTTVTLTAYADSGYAFSGWTGACTGSGMTCTITMNMAKSVTATFT
jgi:uncharacterized repeat protein (TIGR02543 family)